MSQRYIGGVVTETTNVAQSPWTGEWTQQAALQGFAGAQAPLKVANSLRFRSSASAYLNRTPSVAGNRQTFTWSGWVKKAKIATNQYVFGAQVGSSGSYLFFTSSDTLQFYDYVGAVYQIQLITTQVFRDPSAWYHIVLVSDTTQATSSNRIRMYVNGTQITAFGTSTYPSQNYSNSSIDNNNAHYVGYTASTFDGYLAEINFIDGQALTPSSFGEIDSTTGVWKAKRYTGTYGTNGFKLNFSNGTSTTTLGYDSSGNGNNWTTNNISLTAGSTYDWMIDSPTKFPGSSYGVGNYAVLNPLACGSYITLASANLQATGSATDQAVVASTMQVTTPSYWEYTVSTKDAGGNFPRFGAISTFPANFNGNFIASSTTGGVVYRGNGDVVKNSNVTVGTYTALAANDVLGFALDPVNQTCAIYLNNVLKVTVTGITAPYFPAVETYTTSGVGVANFGQRPFAYTPPSGYKSLCTQNLSGVTIQNGAQYMAATLYTGTSASQSIANTVNGVSFQPDFAWIKVRTVANDHVLVDVNRGVNKTLASNTTAAEITESLVTSFNSDGLTLDGIYLRTNRAGNTYVAWQWKAGGTAVTNTAGSITSSVSANQTAGFSVVTYTGTGVANSTVGHGLNVTPGMIIVKQRNGSTYAWNSWHTSLPSGYYIQLNTTSAQDNSVAIFPANTVTSSVFNNGGTGATIYNNASGGTYVAYCFAAIPGFSAFGSYTGNGSSDGPFVYLGFRPRWIMLKRTDSTSDWIILDTSRNTYNVMNASLWADLSSAEGTYTICDYLSNGFKLRDASNGYNTSSGTYIYAAFAENPFQNALAR